MESKVDEMPNQQNLVAARHGNRLAQDEVAKLTHSKSPAN
jgi:hypothetical protein